MRNLKLTLLFVCALILVVGGWSVVLGDWSPGDGHKMVDGPQMPDPNGWDICVGHQYLGDDFECAESGPITDVHLWFSFIRDWVDTTSWEIYIFEDFGGAPGFEPIWMWNGSGQINVIPYGTGQQGWHCPSEEYLFPDDHTGIWQVNITKITDPFIQAAGTRYWLVVGGWTLSFPETVVGWKTSLTENGTPSVFYWEGYWYFCSIDESPRDLAFVITSELDFGDAPDPNYPTLLANDGARHVSDGATYLGASVDIEGDGQPEALAFGDDVLDTSDDEDGVVFTSMLIPGQQAFVDVTASTQGLLNAWVDFNADGDWSDGSEQIFTNQALNAGVNNLAFAVPAQAVEDITFARFRFDSNGNLNYTGLANDGEVEDHAVEIGQQDCEPSLDATGCKQANCQQGNCKPSLVNYDAVTSETTVFDCNCLDTDQCQIYIPPAPDNPCTQPDNGSGTINMPPVGCEYETRPNEYFKIIEGLPPGTTIEMEGILMDFVNIVRTSGGTLGGEIETFDSTLDLTVSGTGSLAGFNRHLAVSVSCEVHTGKRNEGQSVQMFISDMYKLDGELFGDPDFCEFIVRGGAYNDLPSGGRTILTELPTGDYAVDSFFDITYEIEFEGCPGSQLEDYAGITTATVRIKTGDMPSCVGGCQPGMVCEDIITLNPDGSIDISCECEEEVCKPAWDGLRCETVACPLQGDQCHPACVNFDPVTGDTIVTDCDCRSEDECYVQFSHGVDWPCAEPNNGSGTIDLPPECDYTSTEPFMIIGGLPPGTTIEMDGILMDFTNIVRVPGGKLGGEVEYFDSTLDLTVQGTGSLAGFNRHLAVPMECEVHTAPRQPWEPVQVFIMDMNSLTGQLYGDPDFCEFIVRAGTGNGLPSPGQTTLTELPSGDFAVDSFFDITYQIEFEGCAGSQLEDYLGTTTATTRIETGTLPHPACAGDCPPGMVCKKTITANPDGTIDICCDRIPGETPQCIVPDNGTGTIDLPPEDCEYAGPAPEDLWMIIDGLPPGTTIEMEGILKNWDNVTRTSGGTLSGEIDTFESTLDLTVTGTGELDGFNRHLAVSMDCEVHTAPRTPGDPVQTFAGDMYDMTGELFGDPDFCTFRVTAGTGNGLPSPGETTLVELPSGDFAVDSFFDITYQIEFEGCPDSQLADYSGTTEETVHMSTCRQYSFDFDYNGIIDFYDFHTFAVRWLNEDIACCIADHDTDGDVDLADLAYHGLVWLAGSP
jgi:hypothetical protein